MNDKQQKTRELLPEDKLLADQIKKYRIERNQSQKELAENIGTHEQYVSYLETYRRGLSLPMVYKIARALQVPLKALFDFE